MTVTKGRALLLAVTLAGALADIAGSAETRGSTPARLTAISSRLNGKGASLVIEASTPVPYVATRPDPLTVLVDFRNVLAEGLGNSFASSAKGPIASVAVEPTESMGAPTSRVRITLAQPVGYRVRSERNTIVVDFEKPSGKAAPYVMPPASRQNAPDAMKALEQQASVPQPLVTTPAVDPIAALGLDKAPQAAALPNSAVPNTATVPRTGSVAPVPQQPAAPQPPAPEQIGTQRGGQRTYTGHPVSFDFQGADLRAVLRTFAEISGLNIVIDPAVQGTVDVSLHDVPWDQALDIILRANKLGYIVEGTIVRIAPLGVLADEETQKRKLSEEQALAGDLRVFTKTLSYAKAEELQGLLTKSTLSSRGTVQVHTPTNTIIVTDLADRLTMASDLITTLDRAQPQVEIEGRIVQTNKNFARQLGIQWGFGARVDPTLGNTTNLAFPNSGAISGNTGGTQGAGRGTTTSTAVNLAAAAAMELRRLSLARKPMIVVPKHLVRQTETEWLEFYPNATVLVANETDFTPETFFAASTLSFDAYRSVEVYLTDSALADAHSIADNARDDAVINAVSPVGSTVLASAPASIRSLIMAALPLVQAR